MTLEEIIQMEPEVGEVLRQAGERDGEEPYRRYGWYKGRLSRLVGWGGAHPELRGPECYETVLKALNEAIGL